MVDSLDFNLFPQGSNIAADIANKWNEWDSLRSTWRTDKEELHKYVFATDTTNTSNSSLPWKNKTTLPKLTQIRDNLHANYMGALFSSDDWLKWFGENEESVGKDKVDAIQAYMKNKLYIGKFEDKAAQLALDFIDYGNVFATTAYIHKTRKLEDPEEEITIFSGPKAYRIDPNDIVFNPTATTFAASPKIVQSVKSLGDLVRDVEENSGIGYDPLVVEKIMNNRRAFSGYSQSEKNKSAQFKVAGFSNIEHYYGSGYVQLLDFYGDIYDMEKGELLKDQMITVVDGHYILRQTTNPAWQGNSPIYHIGWRERPGNLWAMGPLDNLVGMQYRIDHLENLKADVFDMIGHPMLKVKGDVEDFDYEPGARIYAGDEGDVEFLQVDSTALNADMQIAQLEQKMEDFAGAPKQALGIRTPGEKTAYEVQQLENAAGRVFQNKIVKFEKFLEDIINDMFEKSVQAMNVNDIIKVVDDDVGVTEFIKITKDDVTAKGRLRPTGARHFAAKAQLVQEISAWYASPIGQDPAVNTHISGFQLAKLFEDVLNIERFSLVAKNVRIMEQMESQQMANAAQEQAAVEGELPVEQGEESELAQNEIPADSLGGIPGGA